MSNLNNDNNAVPKRRSSKDPVAFYEVPSGVVVPSKIISDAKQSLKEIPTSRPYTPRDETRFSLGRLPVYVNNQDISSSVTSVDYETESRPVSGQPRTTIISQPSPPSTTQTSDSRQRKSSSKESSIGNSKSSQNTSDVDYSSIPPQSRIAKISSSEITKSKVPSKHSPVVTATTHSTTLSTSTSVSTTRRDSNPRIGSASSYKDETPEETALWNTQIVPLIDTLLTSYEQRNFDLFNRTGNELYHRLNVNNLFSKKCKRRTDILKMFFGFIECDNSIVKYHVARLSLAFQVSSTNNLKNIIRLISDLSGNSENDHFFLTNNLLDLLFDGIERIEVVKNIDTIVYFCCALKNLTVSDKLLKIVSEKNGVVLLQNIFKTILRYKDQEDVKNQICHCLIQITATLRNLADKTDNRIKFVENNLIDNLAQVLKYFTSVAELMKNVARILSKLTQHTDCCLKLVQCPSCYKSFLKILIKHESKQAIIVRICFILGNMLAKSEEARITFMKEKYALETLTKLLHSYIEMDSMIIKPHNFEIETTTREDDGEENTAKSVENVINKVIRVLSNLAISEENGLKIIQNDKCIIPLFSLLDAPKQHSEDLIIHVLMALNNLSYYDDNQSIIVKNAENLTKLLLSYIRNGNKIDFVIEGFRVLGNLSRMKNVRNVLLHSKVDRLAIDYCESDNIELLYAVIGVIINLTVDEDKRSYLKANNGLISLISVLECSVNQDWQLASLVCKALWNYCDNGNQVLWFNNDELEQLFTIFNKTLRKDLLLSTEDEELDKINNDLWKEEYYPVASRLYRRLADQGNHSETFQIEHIA